MSCENPLAHGKRFVPKGSTNQNVAKNAENIISDHIRRNNRKDDSIIKVMIHNGEHNSLVTEFPTAHLRFEEQLHSLGIWNPQGDIFPRDNEDEAIRVKLWSDDAFGNVLLGAVKETDSLRSINTMCRTVCDLKYSKFLELKEKLTVSPPESIKDVFAAVKAVNTPTVSFKLLNGQ